MKNTINLTKIYLKQTLSQFFNRKNRRKPSINILFIVFIFIFVSIAMGFCYYGFGQQFLLINSTSYIIVLGLIFSSFFILLMNVNTMQGQYYQSKDYEFLFSLPIKPISIVSAKYLNSYLISLIYSLTIALPAFIVYFIFNPITVASIIYSIIALLLIPTYMQFIGSIFSYLLNSVTVKLKNKTLINNILTIIVTLFTTGFVIVANNGLLANLFKNGIPLWIKIVLPHIYFLYNSLTTGSIVQFLVFISITLAFAIFSIILVSTNFKKINSSKFTSSKKKLKQLKYTSLSVTKSLLKKESKKFFSSAIYFINCLVGPFLSIALSITLSLTFKKQIVSNVIPAEIIYAIFLCSSMLTICMMPSSASSISVEGKNFFIMKSLPIKFSKFIETKLLFSILINIPFVFISIITFVSIISCSFDQIVIMIITSIIFVILSSTIGILANLKWPKLEWNNEAVAIKQGLSVFITLLSNIILVAIILIPYIVFFFDINSVLSFTLYFLICLCFYIIILIICTTILIKNGEKVYKKIS